MARLLTHKDGRLKTGRVAILVFFALVMALGMAFKANKSVDHALLAVKHVFEPEDLKEPPEKEQAARDHQEKANPQDMKKESVPQPDPALEQEKPPVKPVSEATPAQNEKLIKDHEPPKMAQAEAEQNEPASAQEKIIGQDRALKGKKESSREVSPPEKTLKSSATRVDEIEGAPSAIIPKEALEKMAAAPPDETKERARQAQDLDVSSKLTSLIAPSSPDKREETQRQPRLTEKTETSGSIRAEAGNREIIVKKDQYVRLFRSWQKAGSKHEGSDRVPLRVENLRNTYQVFQMKPVAVVRDRHFVDLSDGSRLAEASLADYSSTVFLVDRPWNKWGDALASAGIGKEEKIEVRYYMYGFIKSAIYARVNQAFSWCKGQGLVPPKTRPESVDVLGRAYVIRQKSGGRFGVFVPVTLDTRDGRSVGIDPVCFNGQPDVEALCSAGLL